MGSLERRLESLETMMARIPTLSEPEAEDRRRRLCEALLVGRDEIKVHSEEERYLLERLRRYVPSFLGLVREGLIPGYDELLASDADFDMATNCSEVVGGRPCNPG